MVLESLGAWSSVECGIDAMVADGRIDAIILQFRGVFGDVFKIFEVITPESLEILRRAVIGRFENFDLSSSTIERSDGRPAHALHIVAS